MKKLFAILILGSVNLSYGNERIYLKDLAGVYEQSESNCDYLDQKIEVKVESNSVHFYEFNEKTKWPTKYSWFEFNNINRGKQKYSNGVFLILGSFEWGYKQASFRNGRLTARFRHNQIGSAGNRFKLRKVTINYSDDSLKVRHRRTNGKICDYRYEKLL